MGTSRFGRDVEAGHRAGGGLTARSGGVLGRRRLPGGRLANRAHSLLVSRWRILTLLAACLMVGSGQGGGAGARLPAR